jgi:5-methylphenazine-1-carboxylate 1-monooxygenase
MNVAIVGGGIAGLALALGLHRHGICATVYEAVPEIKELGVGITLLPHAVRELGTLGLLEEIKAAGIENRASGFYNRFGQKLYSEARGLYAGYEHPEIGIHRGRLHAILYAVAKGRLGRAHIRTGHQLVGLHQDAAGVDLMFKDQACVRADIVVACDGVNSTIRRQFYPEDRVAFTGINTWRGVTRRKPILDGRTYLRVGALKTGKMVIYPIADFEDGTQLINWVAELERDGSAANDWNKGGRKVDVLPIFESFRFDWLDVAALIEDADTVLEYPMVDKDPIDQWTFGRVTFAGDAAHPMYPRGSNGSAQALVDARTLADLLAQLADPMETLKAYEAERAPATAAVVLANRSSPPDIINITVEELVGDRPFDDLDNYISQHELRALSDRYKQVAGFARAPDIAPSFS